MEASKILGLIVNFGDGQGRQHQGTVIGAWLDYGAGHAEHLARIRTGDLDTTEDPRSSHHADRSIRVIVLCNDNQFRDAWLENCTHGAIPSKKEE